MKPEAPRQTEAPAPGAMTTTPGAALRRGTGGDRRPGRARGPLPTRVSETPDLPAAFEDVLESGLAALGLEPGPTARDALVGHVRLLLAWTEAINLTAIRDPAEVARLHVLDSLTAVPLLRAAGTASLLDLGSGGGFPGIPLAVVLGTPATLVDSVARKARFLETVVAALGLAEVTVAATRAETLARGPDRERWAAVTARAVGPLGELVEVGLPLVEPGGRLVAWKRGDLGAELAAGRRALDALGGGTIAIRDVPLSLLPGHLLVEVVKRAPSPRQYPRPPAVRARRPW